MAKKKSGGPGGRKKKSAGRPAAKRKPSSRVTKAAPEKKPRGRKGSARDASPDPGRRRGRKGASKDDSGRIRGAGSSDKGGVVAGPSKGFLKPEGMPLSVKFVLIISSMIAAVMLLSSLVIYFISVGKLQAEIEDSGASMVNSVESLAKAYFEDRSILDTRFRDALYGEQPAPPSSDDGWGSTEKPRDGDKREQRMEDYLKLKEAMGIRYTEYLDAIISMGLQGGASRKVLNAFTDCGEKQYNLNPRTASSITSKGPKRKYYFQGRGTSVDFQECRLKSGEGASQQALLFMKPIEVRGKEVGTAYLALSAEIIADAKSGLLVNILVFTLFAVAVGVGVSFILASQISKPVQALLEDMSKVAKGNFNHVTKAHSKDEIGVLARTFNAMTQSLKQAQELEVQNQARQHDLKIATEIQAGLLPSKIPEVPGYELAAFYQPSKEVGGDYYDFMPVDENHMAMVVADVSGKGIPGSMVMTMARSLIRMEGSRNLSAADTLKKVNRVIARDIRRGMFVTAIYLLLDIKARTLRVASAGHNPMVLFRGKKKDIELVNPNGIALGFDKGPIFDRTIKEEEIQLEKGDRTVIYTDGIPESMNPQNEEFGDENFYDLVKEASPMNSNKFINHVVSTVRKHQGKADQHDDITIATLRAV